MVIIVLHMGSPGFEPGTFASSRRRHNQLDYEPSLIFYLFGVYEVYGIIGMRWRV